MLKASEHSAPPPHTSEETYVQTPYSSHSSAHEAHTSPHSYSSPDYNEANLKRITPAYPHHKESFHNQQSAAQAYQQSPDYNPSPSQLIASEKEKSRTASSSNKLTNTHKNTAPPASNPKQNHPAKIHLHITIDRHPNSSRLRSK